MAVTTAFDLTQTDRLLTTTRSVRKRLDLERPVPRELIIECLQIAVQAPSGGNSQPWRWLIVDDPETKSKIATYYKTSHDPYLAMSRAAAEQAGLKGMQSGFDSSQYLADHLHEVPALVFPLLLTRLPADGNVFETAGFFGSIVPAAWSFMLAARTRGLGAAWTTLHLNFEREVAEILGIPDTVTQIAMIPVAYYTGEDFKPARRRPIEELTYWNGWRKR